MKEFKFNCPTCGQHILANVEWSGRRINCPSCDTHIAIPSPDKNPKVTQQGSKPRPKPQPDAARSPLATRSKKAARASAGSPAPTKSDQTEHVVDPSDSGLESSNQPRIAALTPAIKLDMVRSVRRRLTDESSWLPGKVKGAIAYAAKAGGKAALVNVQHPEAVRFSLYGAFLLELHRRRVVRTAPGRTKLLDQEIPDAIRDMLLDQMSEAAREQADDPLATNDIHAISHLQCLAVLDVMEERYSHKMEQARIEKVRRRLGNVRLADLVRKLEKKGRVAPEDVATALYHELTDIHRRLDRVENKLASSAEMTSGKLE